MAKAKDSGKELTSNPFKTLKGLRVSSSQKDGKTPSAPRVEVPDVDVEGDTQQLFAREMALLGVEPAGDREPPAVDSPPVCEAESEATEAPLSEGELFLSALGRMDVTFADELPADKEPQAAPRRMKLLRQGKLHPEATLDLHGMTREEARAKVRFFLEDSLYQGRKTVLVITGRGKSSGSEPVLRAEMEQYLGNEGRAWVSEWGRAPRQYGGEGALVVFLRTRG